MAGLFVRIRRQEVHVYICYRRLIRHEWIYYGSKNCVIYNSVKNRRFHVPQPTFSFPLETPLRLSRNMLHGWKDNSMLAKPLAACTYLSSIISELSQCVSPKIAIFTTFLFPLGKSRSMLYGWKENSMLTNCLAACTHLSSTVSQLFEPYKKSPFSRTAAHIFVSPGDAPATITQYVAWVERQFNACQIPHSM